jgi:hypothetical protein
LGGMNQNQSTKKIDKAVVYAFLSAIKEKSGNITSLLSIFEELTEGILSDWTRKGTTSARIVDLQDDFKKTYDIIIPIPTLRVILNKISKKYSGTFTIHNDDSFIITDFPNRDLSYIVDQQKKSINLLFSLYNSYLSKEGLESSKHDLLEYIEENKKQVMSFVSGNLLLNSDDFHVQANFIKELLSIPEYNPIIQRLFLGSIISSYIELDIDESMDKSKTLLLDTNFVVSLLDLHSIESFINCKMLVEIARKLKYKIEVMPFTIDETSALLNRIASNLSGITYFQAQDKDSIYNGCLRKNIDASSLSVIAKKIASKLQNDYGIIQTDLMTNSALINQARQSKIYAQLKGRIHNPDGALHDATALYYIQKLRNSVQNSFADINAWFVTDTKGYSENNSFSPNNIPLMIRAEELLNIMWISHPLYNSNEFIQATMTRILSGTLNSSLPDRSMLREIDKKLQAIKDFPINTRDCIQVAEVLGSIENQQLKLLAEAKTQQEIVSKLHQLSVIAEQKAQSEKLNRENITKMAIDNLKKSYEREKLTMEKIKKEEMEIIGIETRNEAASKEIVMLDELIKRDSDELEMINDIIVEHAAKAERKGKRILYGTGIICLLLICILAKIIFNHWDIAEPILYLLSLIPAFLFYFVAVSTTKHFSIKSIKEVLVTRIKNKESKKDIYFLNKVAELEKCISENKQKKEDIKQSLLYN